MIGSSLLSLAMAAVAVHASPAMYARQAPINSTTTATATASGSASFPTDVGYLGTTKPGLEQPFLVNTDTLLNSTEANAAIGPSAYETRFRATDDTDGSFNIWARLGNTSPYASSQLFNETAQYGDLEPGCEVTGVHVLHRHGARFPTSSTSEGAPLFGATVANATNLNATGPLAFLNDWRYTLGAEVLVAVGRQQLFDSGVKHFLRYGGLYNESTQTAKPVVRTTSQSRMLDSARYFALGFWGYDAPEKINLEVIIEADGFNNTLAPYDTCNNSNTLTVGDLYLTPVWRDIYLKDATARLQPYVTGLNLTTDLVYGMQSLCAYETQALGISEFCGLFTKAEWEGFEYFLDLQFQGDYGAMSPSGRSQGIGWVQELLARLSNGTIPSDSPVTTQNTTLNGDSAKFPTDQNLYLDFTHDDVIVSVLTALNFTVFADYLDPTEAASNRSFILSQITPFAARLAFERISCSNSSSSTSNTTAGATTASNSSSTTYIRTVLNDAIVPMGADVGCTSSTPNPTLCLLEEFVAYQNQTAVMASNFDKACFGVNGTDFNITGPSIRNGTVA